LKQRRFKFFDGGKLSRTTAGRYRRCDLPHSYRHPRRQSRRLRGRLAKKWVVERGIEIISEASRRLSEDLKARHLEIQWKQIAGIGNVLRHEYEQVSAPILWKVVQSDLDPLEEVCRTELKIAKPRAQSGEP
jgi:uncharacterized protein with HEPN domain